MESKPTFVNKKWLLCTTASFLGFLLLLLCINHGSQRLKFKSLRELEETSTELVVGLDDNSVVPDSIEVIFPEKELKEEPRDFVSKKCDIFDGMWVYDPQAYPLYRAPKCPFLSDQVSCQKNGRPDSSYESWRWEAKECQIPRFNGTDMLESLRGKRMVIVGDSLNRNQWESIACLLYSAIPPARAYVNVRSSVYKVFQAKDYNCSVEFYWSPFLVQLEETRAKSNVLKLDVLSSSSRYWQGADVMVFNTGHWWVHRGKLKAWDFFQLDGKMVKEMDVQIAYEMAMQTWSRWINRNVDPAKTTVFFRSISPEHKGGKQWCYNQTSPIMDESYVESFPTAITNITEKTIREMAILVKYLNITKLSEYRKDAHAAMYTERQGKLLTEEQRRQPKAYADCSHWCLPGLPDTWNALLFAYSLLETATDAS